MKYLPSMFSSKFWRALLDCGLRTSLGSSIYKTSVCQPEVECASGRETVTGLPYKVLVLVKLRRWCELSR